MVCAKCEQKLSKVAASDPFRNRDAGGSLKASGKKTAAGPSTAPPSASVGPSNKLLSNKNRYTPYGGSSGGLGSSKCKICSTTVSLQGGTYCHNCAYKRGVCARCGKMLLDSKTKAGMKMSS